MSDVPNGHRGDRVALLALAGVSGLGGVVYEVLYLRQLTTVLGDMFYVHAALLGTFLLGNGIGARLAHRFPGALFAFEMAIGLYAVALPWALPLYEASALAQLFTSPVGQTLFMSALMLAVPSVCIGFSVPLFSATLRAQGATEDAFKLTYLLYNAGAALSVIVVEFGLIRWIGYTSTLAVLGAANFGCGLALLARRARWRPDPAPEEEPLSRRSSLALLLASTGAAVFLAFTIKISYHLFHPHRENFAILTAISVSAIAIGTALVRRTRMRFATCVVLAMLTLVGTYTLFDPIVLAYQRLEDVAPVWTSIPRKVAFGFALALPYVFLGAMIPALLPRESDVARRSGRLLLVSGIGNVAGLLGFTFLVHPWLTIFAAPAVVWTLLGGALLVATWPRIAPRLWVAAAASAALLPFVVAHPEERVYLMHQAIGPGAQVESYKAASDNVTYLHHPIYAIVSYNGHPGLHVVGNGRVNQAEVTSGVIPALVAPRLNRALVLGLGSGITGGATATLFGHTDIVEINTAFLPLVEILTEVNFGVAGNPRATIIHDDARRYLSRTPHRYDAIVNSIPSPTYYSAGKIYTSEFFEMVKTALTPGGVYVGWFAPGEMSLAGIDTLLFTLSRTFRHCDLAILRRNYLMTSCADRPVTPRRAAEIGIPPDVARALLGSLRGLSVDEYLANIFVSEDIFARMDFSGIRLNTDDFPVLEFQIMRLRRIASSGPAPDPLLANPERFDLTAHRREDDATFLTRAVLFAQIYDAYHQRFYRERLRRNSRLAARFDERMRRVPD